MPIVIYGARRKLPAGRLLPAPGPLRVRICEPVDPAASGARAHARDAHAMLVHLDEPDLAPAPSGTARRGPRRSPSANPGYIPE